MAGFVPATYLISSGCSSVQLSIGELASSSALLLFINNANRGVAEVQFGREKLLGRESHHGIVLDPFEGELTDASMQGDARKLRLAHIRRKSF
jgi:hypothetical protein